MQTYSANNLWKFERGSQIDIGVASGGEAIQAEDYWSITEFNFPEGSVPSMIEDNEGNRSSNQAVVFEDKTWEVSLSGTMEVDKVTRPLYYLAGKITAVQDGSTGAYTNTIEFINSVILPAFTLFYRSSTGFVRLKNCQMKQFDITGAENDKVAFTATIEGTGADFEPSIDSTIASIGITDIEYQSGSFEKGGTVMRATLTATDLSSVKNGDVFRVPSTITGITNSEHIGDFIVVEVNDTNDTIDFINNRIFDTSKDETGLTTNTVSSVLVVSVPSYPDPTAILMNRQTSVKDAASEGALSTEDFDGLKNFDFSLNNNSEGIREKAKSDNNLTIAGGRITMDLSFTQTAASRAILKKYDYDELSCNGVNRFWLMEIEDQCKYLGNSTTLRPLLSVQVEGLGVATPQGGGGGDLITLDWTVQTQQQQTIKIIVQSEIDGSTF